MTQQVRTTYRNHRRGTWAVFIAVATLVAAVLIPVASGAPEKTYTLAFAPATQQKPNPSLNRSFCTGDGGTVELYLTNTAKTASLGSAQIILPSYVTSVAAFKSLTGSSAAETPIPSGADFDLSAGIVSLQNLSLDKFGYVKLVLTVPATASSFSITSVVKQSNNFNDTSGTANLFSDPSDWPAVAIANCNLTISGTLSRDADGNGTGDTPLTTPRTVSLTGSSQQSKSFTGTYSFTVPKNGSYTVCASAVAGEVQTKPNDGDVATSLCATVDGYSLQNLTDNSSNNDFAFAGGVTATCGPSSTLESKFESGNATVKARFTTYDATCKAAGQQFVFTTYSNGASRTANLSPVNSTSGDCSASDGAGCQIVAEVITWTLSGTSPDTKTLTYDDTAQGGSSGTMKFCVKDPFDRSASDGLTLHAGITGPHPNYYPSDILPSGETTCLARTTQGRYFDSSTSTWVTKRIDEVYSAYDGKISFG